MTTMRIHLCLLLVTLLCLAPTKAASCIKGCKCTIDSTVLKVLGCDGVLDLTEETLAQVPANITTAGFKNVNINKIDAKAFQKFATIEIIVFEDSNIGKIDASAFFLPELGKLTFIRTSFGDKPTFSSEYLGELVIDDCKLTEVPNLDNLLGLTYLKLTHNLIESIDPAVFKLSENLEEVDLSNNSISELSADLFINNTNLNTLTVDNNPLTKFELNFKTELEVLSMKNCKLTSFDRPLSENLPLLTDLYLSGNEISILPLDAFAPLTNLNTIDLSNNKLVELDDDIFRENVKLFQINLNNNPFKLLPKFQSKDNSFETSRFTCQKCGLSSIQGSLDQMKTLKFLDLSDNKLTDIDGLFLEINYLSEVSLRNNQITNIRINSFGNNTKLTSLDLSHNPLQPLDPVVLGSLKYLQKLNVSSCGLETLWANHNSELPALEQLFLSENKLTTMTVSDVKILPKLNLLDIRSLPCTANSSDLVDYLRNKMVYRQESWINTHENLIDSDKFGNFNSKREWSAALPEDCIYNDDDYDEDDDDDDYEDDDKDDDFDSKDDDDDILDDDDLENDDVVEASVLNGMNLTKVSYILSVTTVFILTALLVLFVAVVITLFILKRNRSFNMHNGNLPRLKIPLWHAIPGHKKHSGSVYKPLSEELTGSRIMNWYDFKQTPQVHNSLP